VSNGDADDVRCRLECRQLGASHLPGLWCMAQMLVAMFRVVGNVANAPVAKYVVDHGFLPPITTVLLNKRSSVTVRGRWRWRWRVMLTRDMLTCAMLTRAPVCRCVCGWVLLSCGKRRCGCWRTLPTGTHDKCSSWRASLGSWVLCASCYKYDTPHACCHMRECSHRETVAWPAPTRMTRHHRC